MKITSGSASINKFACKAALALGLLVGSGAAYSAPVVWDLGCEEAIHAACRNANYASPHSFLDDTGLFTLKAYGFDATNTATNLFSKFTGFNPGETGLGLLSDPEGDNEIFTGWYIDLVLPTDARLSGTYHLTVSSVQNPEKFNVYMNSGATQGAGSKTGLLFANQTNLSPNCVVATSTCQYDIIVGANRQFVIEGLADNVLVNISTTFTPAITTPEPVSLALVGLGLLAAGITRRRKA